LGNKRNQRPRPQCPVCGGYNTKYKLRRKNGKYKIYCKDCKVYRDVIVPPANPEIDNDGRGKTLPEFLDKKIGETVDWREWLQVFDKQQELHQRQSWSQDDAVVELPNFDNNRAIIIFSADWHLGSISVNYKEFKKHIELLLETPHVYMVTVGDLIDNFRRFNSLQPVLSQVANPKDQVLILRSLLDEFWKKKKWIGACWGNHDVQRDEAIYGQSAVKELISHNIPYFNGKGTLGIKVGNEKYSIRMSHYFQGNSIYNQLHSAMREMRFHYPFADVFVSAHKHTPAITNTFEFGQRKCFIRTGAFEIDSGYSKRFWDKGIIGTPAVVFRTDRHEVFAYPSLEELLEFRGNYTNANV